AVLSRPRRRGSRRPGAPTRDRRLAPRRSGTVRPRRPLVRSVPERRPRDRQTDIHPVHARSCRHPVREWPAIVAAPDERLPPHVDAASSPWSSTPPPPWVAPWNQSRDVNSKCRLHQTAGVVLYLTG